MDKGVAYCLNKECSERYKGIFILNEMEIRCPGCRTLCAPEYEQRTIIDKGYEFTRSVIVNFAFSAEEKRYTQQAIVEIENAVGGNLYEIHTPIVSMEKRALSIAEMMLAALSTGSEHDGIKVLSFDNPIEEFKKDLAKIDEMIDTRNRRINSAR